MTELKAISPEQAAALIRDGAVLIDIREADEFARERIAGALNRPLSRLGKESIPDEGCEVMVFHCRSGARTSANSARLAALARGEAYFVEGGLQSWTSAGLPVLRDRKQPIEIMRQVQIVAGSFILLGVLLGAFLAPVFHGVAAFVGAGLVFAGVTGTCGMAKVLSLMPWNRRTATCYGGADDRTR